MIWDDVSSPADRYWSERRSVPGHMYDIDFLLFDRLLATQSATGDLLEIGAYLGKSAILLGAHARPDETVWVCDVFEDQSGDDAANASENEQSYVGLTRAAYEANYARFVERPSRVIQELSTNLRQHIGDRTLRFVHVDGGHLFGTVRADLANVDALATGDAIVALDDIRSVHAPGVAAAAWEAVSQGRLHPICISEIKLYLSPSPDVAAAAVADLRSWFGRHSEVHFGVQHVQGIDMVVVVNPTVPTWRSRTKSLIPPALVQRLRKPALPHLGD